VNSAILTVKMLEAGNIIQGVAKRGELLKGAYILITYIDMLQTSHYANICK